MARYLDENISPGDITADNIRNYDRETNQVLNQVQNVDMANFTTGVNNLVNYKQQKVEKKHLKGRSLPSSDTVTSGTVFFMVSEILDQD